MSYGKRLTGLTVLWLIIIRMSIGWHLLYEGLWKIHSMKTADPWTSAGYLRNSQGPMRDKFRELTGDPDELNWLDYDHMINQWDSWLARFKQRHPDLTEDQLKKLDVMINGPKEFTAKLSSLPKGIAIPKELAKVVSFDENRKLLVVDGTQHLLPTEREKLLNLIAKPENGDENQPVELSKEESDYIAAVKRVAQLSSRLSYKEQLAATLKADPQFVGQVYTDKSGNVLDSIIGDIELYRQELDRYEAARAKARQDFQFEHLDKIWSDLQQLRLKLVGPIKAMTKEMKRDAEQLLTTEQLLRGSVSEPWTELRMVDVSTMWGLTIFGGLLIAGLFSRLSALGAAVLLTLFYLAMPPWPGVPAPPGPQHSFIINQHLLEVFMLLLLAMLPTGKWFGMDAFFGRSGK